MVDWGELGFSQSYKRIKQTSEEIDMTWMRGLLDAEDITCFTYDNSEVANCTGGPAMYLECIRF